MLESQVSRNASEVRLSLAVAASLKRVLDGVAPLQEALRREIARGVADSLQTLGIPSEPQVQIIALEAEPVFASQFMRLLVNEHLCPYADELLWRIYSYVSGAPLSREVESSRVLAWLVELLDGQAESVEADHQIVVEFLSLTCLEIIKEQPAVLLGPAQVAAYLASLADLINGSDLPSGTWPLDANWLLPVLADVLSLKISIADKQKVAEVIKEGLMKGQSQAAILEDLIVALRTDVVEIQLPADYFRQITTADSAGEHDKFALMRDGLFYELGARYPRFEFVPNESLKPNSFAFKINHLTMLPWVGLPSDQWLVNDTPDRLKLLNIQGRAALNPANANECSLVGSSAQSYVEAAGLQTWNQIEYLVLCFSVSLRENGACFIHRQVVQDQLQQLEQAFPALVKAAQAKISLEPLTRVLRALIAEEIPIRNLRSILEWLVDYDYVVINPLHYILLDDRLPVSEPPNQARINNSLINLTSFVRAGMKRYISHKYTRGQNTLLVYLLDPEIEEMLVERQVPRADNQREQLSPNERNQILEAVRAEVETLSPSSTRPVILTSIAVRPYLRELIAPAFPRMPVVAYQELAPDLNIKPIARISLYP